MGSFRRVVDDLELKEVHLNGRSFTWTSVRESPTLEGIDRVFLSSDWDLQYPDCFLRVLPSTASDHCPSLFSTSGLSGPKKRFRFETFWSKMDGF